MMEILESPWFLVYLEEFPSNVFFMSEFGGSWLTGNHLAYFIFLLYLVGIPKMTDKKTESFIDLL